MKYCFLDLETTGLEHEKDSLLEISFIITDEKLQEQDRLDEVVIPHKTPLTPFVTHLTGITPEEVQKRGKNWDALIQTVNEKIGDATIVGHNIDFDIRFLKENGVPLANNKRIDTHELARILLPGDESFSLEAITQRLGLDHADAHRAMSDVIACIQLWPILIEKIQELPQEAIPEFSTFFTQSTWAASELFLQYCGQKSSDSFCGSKEKEEGADSLPEIDPYELEGISQEHTTFVRVGYSGKSARWLAALAQKNEQKTLIIAPELSFFPGISQMPTPSVLFDPERHMQFWKGRKTMDDLETTFWLQCAVRHWLGHRGVQFFNLYLHQRDFWKEVCVESIDHPIFQGILKERTPEKVLLCTPAAWMELCDLPLFRKRQLLVFETEIFAEKLLFAGTKTFSLRPFLEQTETPFFIARFVREVMEQILQRRLSGFPEKVLLPAGRTYPEFATALTEISETSIEAAQWLQNPETELVRWASYFPETGTLSLSAWHPAKWRSLQQKLNDQKAIFCIRHNGGESNAFCRVFLNRQEGMFLPKPDLEYAERVTISRDTVSSKSPDFLPFCANTIKNLAEQEDAWVSVGFSSLATLKNVGEMLRESPPEGCSVLGEKLAGGDTKVISHLLQEKKAVFLFQKLQSPAIEHLPFETFIVQKFPFAPPHPLLEYFKSAWKNIEQDFWDVWVIPTVTARLSRMAGLFGNLKNVLILDPAESSPWGKTVIQNAFPSAHK